MQKHGHLFAGKRTHSFACLFNFFLPPAVVGLLDTCFVENVKNYPLNFQVLSSSFSFGGFSFFFNEIIRTSRPTRKDG